MSNLHYFRPDWITKTDRTLKADVCIYGANAAGVVTAIECKKRGKSVVLLQPGKFIGGLTTGGLGETDFGKQHVIGGIAREFYRQTGKHIGKEEDWKFAPHVATAVFEEWLKTSDIEVRFCQYVERAEVVAGRITSITLMGGLKVQAKVFIDCSYEGDLLHQAGVSHHIGREANDVYGETINGIQVRAKHQFVPARVSPYIKAGEPSSGLLPQVEAIDQQAHQGEGDHRIQAYNFRICMTDDPALRIDWEKPEQYDPLQYVLAARWFAGEKDTYNEGLAPPSQAPAGDRMRKFDVLTNRTPGGFRKTDTNNHGPVSSDFIGASWEWPSGCYECRERIFQEHVTYQKGLYWFMANSPDVPDRYHKPFKTFGLAKDEFVTCGGWSPQLYVREARRMISDYVMTEADTMHRRQCEDPVGMGSYALDSHNCTRFVNKDGFVMNDGDIQLAPKAPYGISYRSIVPKRQEVTNLFVPVCCSASHIAYGSVRMEPVFMILGQSAAVSACMAIDANCDVQAVPYPTLREELERLGQVLIVK